MISVCVVENEALVREGLRRVLELDPELRVCAEAADPEAALAALAKVAADVVLLDMRMPGGGGLRVLEGLGRSGRGPPCLVLTTFDDPDAFLDAARAGARGYLLKDVSPEELGQAIRALAAGGTWFKPSLTEGVLRGLSASRPSFEELPEEPLTAREREVLRMMAGGFSNREIAAAISVAERTVKNHVSAVLAKLGVRDRTRAVLKALERRLF